MRPEAPGAWTLERLGTVAEVLLSNVDKKSSAEDVPVRLCNYMDVYTNARITADLPFMEATATAAQVEKFGLRVGDVVITKDSEDPSDIAVPSVVVDEFDGSVVCGYHLAILRPRDVDGPYLAWTLRSRPVNDQFTRRANGSTRFGLTNDVIQSAWIPLPPLPEQRKIAAILSSVDDAIAATRKVIEQTKRVKRGLLQTLMTRGIGHTRFKKTEIGEIPEAWEVVPLGQYIDVLSGFAFESKNFVDDPSAGPRLVRIRDLSGESEKTFFAGEFDERYGLHGGEILVGMDGDFTACRWLEDGAVLNQRVCRVSTSAATILRDSFLYHLLTWHLPEIQRRIGGTTVKHLSVKHLRHRLVQLPPPEEQDRIALALDTLEILHARHEQLITNIDALKRGLMQDLLTGRVRVQPD